MKDGDEWTEYRTQALDSIMFGDPNHLENNMFSTSHQSVNMYGLPEKCYEIRTEDSAIDVQVHRGAPGESLSASEIAGD